MPLSPWLELSMFCVLRKRSFSCTFGHSLRLATSAALLPTSQAQGALLETQYLEKLATISQRLKKYLGDLRWPRLRHLQVGGVCYQLPLSSRRVDMSSLLPNCPKADLQYLAGFFDGDGCVSVETKLSGCTLSVCQSVCGQEVLLAFLRVFGGTIRVLSHGKGCTRPALNWEIHGNNASLAAQLLQEHCTVKKEQLCIAATWPSNTLDRIHCSSRLAKLKPLPSCMPKALSWSYVTGFLTQKAA